MARLNAMRPRRAFVVPRPHPEVLAAVRARLARPGHRCDAMMAGNHLELLIAEPERHFWSPWLSVDVLPDPEGTRIKCRYGPHPSLWTAIASIYALLCFVALVGAVFGSTQALLGQSPVGLAAVPAALLLGGGLYAGSQVGQRLGAEQMQTLDDFLDSALETDAPGAEA